MLTSNLIFPSMICMFIPFEFYWMTEFFLCMSSLLLNCTHPHKVSRWYFIHCYRYPVSNTMSDIQRNSLSVYCMNQLPGLKPISEYLIIKPAFTLSFGSTSRNRLSIIVSIENVGPESWPMILNKYSLVILSMEELQQ